MKMEEFCKQLKIINDALEKILHIQFDSEIKYPTEILFELETALSKAVCWVAKQKKVQTPPIALFNDEIDHILEAGYKWD